VSLSVGVVLLYVREAFDCVSLNCYQLHLSFFIARQAHLDQPHGQTSQFEARVNGP